ncbi:MAG TPA: hypothetical protein PKC98_08575 [Candidatus Melainabacteria bacterium]|nr:hypothetical protein [Candidatus Melainabacteria bacterium]
MSTDHLDFIRDRKIPKNLFGLLHGLVVRAASHDDADQYPGAFLFHARFFLVIVSTSV